MDIRTRITLVICVVGVFSIGLCARSFLRHISKPRIIGRAISPDGVEMCIIQECNWDFELFTTSFLYRRPGTEWGWFYYDHQDGYWRTSRVSLDTNAKIAVFYRGRSPTITFDWGSDTFTLHRWSRTLTGVQSRLPADWSPQTSVFTR